MARGPAYTRLGVDERRRRLLELGTRLFARFSYDELSMARIAREAGISKALLYHYFPSKQAFFVATLDQQAADLAARVGAVDESLPPAEQLAAALDAFLGWVEEHAEGYAKLLVGAATHPEVRELVEGVREQTAGRILAGIDHRWLLPLSAVLGGALLCAADVVGRVVARPEEIDVGIVTALIGAPVFIALVRRMKVRAL